MPKKWTGEVVGLMHTHRITNIQLAAELGVTDRYVSMVLNGRRDPKNAESIFRNALDKIIEEKTQRP